MFSRTPPSAPWSGRVTVKQESLQPTFIGYVATTRDALVLFEACLSGHLKHVRRRPHRQERNSLIHSGSIFIYAENDSGIKRWTDVMNWSPSRILGNFFIYRELNKPFPLGGEKKAISGRQRRTARQGEPYPRPNRIGESYSQSTTPTGAERQLIGSLTDSYDFKPDGLVKKTISVTVQGVTHHLVSYYNTNDIQNDLLQRPSQLPALSAITPRPQLMEQRFRIPLIYQPMNQQIHHQTSNSYHAGSPAHPQSYYPTAQPYLTLQVL